MATTASDRVPDHRLRWAVLVAVLVAAVLVAGSQLQQMGARQERAQIQQQQVQAVQATATTSAAEFSAAWREYNASHATAQAGLVQRDATRIAQAACTPAPAGQPGC